MDRRLLVALVLPLALTACGDDGGSEDSSKPDPKPSGTTQAPSAAPEAGSGSGPITDGDEAAISATLTEFLVTGDCDLATDDYLRSIALFADESTSREEACASWEDLFSEPLFGKDDVRLTELEGSDGVATVEVGSDLANITTLYQLTLTDGTWLVSGDEFNTDGL
ncbi:hypothetical protein [Nocardioides daeguensis]|uniref:Nuclear transport factor 2 family protein n=1 Tax=Nocardioides daeguensis TaxID=908359 RepID=A0ABP6V4Z0_9ACTN|nr:hypothetical protein [Nocardioides daeguensis]MBV6729675.1 hypothetical protein [Nocardioides daeguensis]MCR1774720.1 hypothetical protein [Nocardioides daeguensis]